MITKEEKRLDVLNGSLDRSINNKTILQKKKIEFTKKYGSKSLSESQLKIKNTLEEKLKKNSVDLIMLKAELKQFLKKKGGTLPGHVDTVDDILSNIIQEKQNYNDTVLLNLYRILKNKLYFVNYFSIDDIEKLTKQVYNEPTNSKKYDECHLSIDSIKQHHKQDNSNNKLELYTKDIPNCLIVDGTNEPVVLGRYNTTLEYLMRNLESDNSANIFGYKHTVFGDEFVTANAYEVFLLNCVAYLKIKNKKKPQYDFENTTVFTTYNKLYNLIEEHHSDKLKQYNYDLRKLVNNVYNDDENFEFHNFIYQFEDVEMIIHSYNFLKKRMENIERFELKRRFFIFPGNFNLMYMINNKDSYFYYDEPKPRIDPKCLSQSKVNTFFNAIKTERINVKKVLDSFDSRQGIAFKDVHIFLKEKLELGDKHPFTETGNIIDFEYADIMNYFNFLIKQTYTDYDTKLTPYAKDYIEKVYQSFKNQILNSISTVLGNVIDIHTTITVISQLQNINRAEIVNEYFNNFENFVFKGDSLALGMGAYLISLIVIIVSPPYNLIDAFVLMEEDITLPLFTNYTQIKSNIDNKTEGNTVLQYFHQSPFLLGLLSFILPDKSVGSCQDNTLINMIAADKQNNLNGFSLYGSENKDISHWNTNQEFQCHGGVLRFKVGSFGIRPGESLGKRPPMKANTETPKITDSLFKADVNTSIEKDNYEIRALVFLAMTLSHVYRHIQYETNKSINAVNGTAFTKDFATSIITKVMNTEWKVNKNLLQNKSANSNSPIENISFKDDANLTLLITLLNRNVEDTKEIFDENINMFVKKQETCSINKDRNKKNKI